MWRHAAAALALAGSGRAACPDNLDPYSAETNPWGWPVTPSDFSFHDTSCWAGKYAMCGGAAHMQSPVTMVNCGSLASPEKGATVSPSFNKLVPDNTPVQVSKYMRTVSMGMDGGWAADGQFLGSLILNPNGLGDHYSAKSVHLVAPALHQIPGETAAAEMFILHHLDGKSLTEHQFVATSVLFKEGDAPNALFTAMVDSAPSDTAENYITTASVNLADIVTESTFESFFSYHGSMPVPPCWTTVKWLVSMDMQSATTAQVHKLKSMLHKVSGSTSGRTGKELNAVECEQYVGRNVVKSADDACAGLSEDQKMMSSACWASLESQSECTAHSPVNVPPETPATEGEPLDTPWADMVHYHAVETVTAMPGDFWLHFSTLGGHGHGDFGYLDIHGRQFVAEKFSLKAVSMHTVRGHSTAGELVISHKLFGDTISHHEGAEHEHEVRVSIPLSLGLQSPMLTALGFGSGALSEAVHDGHGYTHTVAGGFDLNSYVKDHLADWSWYSGGPGMPAAEGCGSEWGVRWLVSNTPMNVSLEQLNMLKLKVSGVDSSGAVVPSAHTWKSQLPDFAVDKDDTCPDSVSEYGYENIHCWGKYSISNNECKRGYGDHASPINIVTSSLAGEGTDNFLHRVNWKPVEGLQVKFDQVSMLVHSTELGYATLYSQEGRGDGFPAYYQVTNFTMHMPSEHQIDGHHADGELMVGMNKQFTNFDLHSDDAVIASFMFTIGDHDNIVLEQMLHAVEHAHEEGHHEGTIEQPVDLMQVLGPALEGDFYHYHGSLTRPTLACSQVANWYVFSTPLTMSQSQVDRFRHLVPSPGNNRPIQPSEGRKVYKNSFEEGTLPVYDFYLGRESARDRLAPEVGLILLPIFGTLILGLTVMISTFVHTDKETKANQAGGLMESAIGMPADTKA